MILFWGLELKAAWKLTTEEEEKIENDQTQVIMTT